MSTIHLEHLGRIHDFRLIAAIISRWCPANEIEKSPIKQGAMDSSFLLDNVIHISRNLKFLYKKTRPFLALLFGKIYFNQFTLRD
jgi:hypothetical protein